MFNNLQIKEDKIPPNNDSITKDRLKLEVAADKRNNKFQTIVSKSNGFQTINKADSNFEIPFHKKNLTDDEIKEECFNLMKHCVDNNLLPDYDSFIHIVRVDNNGDKVHGFALLNAEEIQIKDKK